MVKSSVVLIAWQPMWHTSTHLLIQHITIVGGIYDFWWWAEAGVACVAGARRGKERGIRAKHEKRARRARAGGGVAPAASLLFCPLCPLINMQMQDIC